MLRLSLLAVVVAVGGSCAAPATQPRADVSTVRFLLWTRTNPDQYYNLLFNDSASLAASPLVPSDPTVLMVHGWTANGYTDFPVDGKTELLALGSYNAISVDWEELAAPSIYPLAVENVPLVGEHTARFLEWLQAEAGLDVAQLRMVGHSLGAHLCGFTGMYLTAFELPMLTGLDPAGPWYYNQTSIDEKLDPSDAAFVQVIHTEGCSILQTCSGLRAPAGDADFYPNGGEQQPGCISQSQDGPSTRGCNHGRAYQYWVESINGSPAFVSHPCSSYDAYVAGQCSDCGPLGCPEMGFHVDRRSLGLYYLNTNQESPFAQG